MTVLILAEIGFHAVEYSEPAGRYSRRGLEGVDPSARRFAANQPYAIISDKMIEAAYGIGAAAYAGEHRIRKSSFLFEYLFLDLLRDNRLKITDNGRERMRSHNRTEAIVGIADTSSPLAHRFADGVLQGCRACGNRYNLRTEQTHFVDVERLTFGILLAHKYNALHSHQGCRGSRRNSVLTRACLGDKPCLAHLFGEQRLSENVVDLVRAGVVEVLALQVYFRAAEVVCHLLRKVQTRRSAGILIKELRKLPVELRVVFIVIVGFFKLDHRVHQRFGDILSAVNAESSFWICHITLPL